MTFEITLRIGVPRGIIVEWSGFFSGFYYITIYFVCKDITMSDIFCFAECDIRLRRVIYECRDNSRHSCDIPLRGIEEDFAFAKSTNLPPHPSRFARHLPRHGKADRFASADNQGEDSKTILFLCFYSLAINRLLYFYYTVTLPFRICCPIKIPPCWICCLVILSCWLWYLTKDYCFLPVRWWKFG